MFNEVYDQTNIFSKQTISDRLFRVSTVVTCCTEEELFGLFVKVT